MAVLPATPQVVAESRKNVVLNPQQRKAVEHVHGPMLVVAGAGTGKTTVLTERVSYLIEKGHAQAGEILAVTYTEDAAREVSDRVAAGLGSATGEIHAHTFHSYCFRLLQRAGRDFRVLDEQDLWIYLRRRISDLGLKHFIKAANVGIFLTDLLQFFSRCHDELRTPADFRNYIDAAIAEGRPLPRVAPSKHLQEYSRDELIGRCREIARVYEKVESMLATDGFGTFSHMVTNAVRLLRADAQLLREEQSRARFILVDEFQDANLAQIELVHLLAGESANVFAVGDPDQAIYHFRGANAGAFEQFLSRFPGTRGVSLEENQRSTSPVLRCAFSVISKNPKIANSGGAIAADFERHRLRSAREELAAREGRQIDAPPVTIVYAPAQRQEAGGEIHPAKVQAAEVAAQIDDLHRASGAPWSSFAVLYRINAHRNDLAEELAARDIPFDVRGLDVLDVPEVRDLLAILRAIVNPGDAIALLRVAALPQFRIDPNQLRRGLREAGREATMVDVLNAVVGGPDVLAALETARAAVKAKKSRLTDAMGISIRQFRLRKVSPPLEALGKFARGWSEKPLTREATVSEFISYLDLFVEARGSVALPMPDGRDAVQLMTAHAAKGLEFAKVYILRANSGSFPCSYHEPLFEFPLELRDVRTTIEAAPKQLHGEEERRLFYVAMTRAKDGLTICAKPTGKGEAPAGFVRDLVGDRTIRDVLVAETARPYRISLAAGAAAVANSAVASWMSLEPRAGLAEESLSASAVETYNLCPLRFKIQRDWRLPEEPAAAMQFGSVVHNVLRDYYEAQRSGRPLADEQVISSFRTLLEAANITDPDQRKLYDDLGMRQLAEFLALRRNEPPVQLVATEKTFRIEIGGALVTGRIDRIDRLDGANVAIVDYKTGSPKDQEDADESLQLSIYALAVERALKLLPARLFFYNLETNQAIMTERSREQLLEAETTVREVATRIADGDFAPDPGFHCKRCSYRDLCPATEERLFDLQRLAKPVGVH